MTRIQLRRDTAANWTSNNPVLSAGEPGFETDTNKQKIGDGATAWTGLAYQVPAALPLAGGTMSGAIAMGAHKVTGLANGTASTDAAAFGQIPAPQSPALLTGACYVLALSAGANNRTYSNGTENATPFFIAAPVTIKALGINVTSGGATGSLYRLGIRFDSAGSPGNVACDAGTVATTGTGQQYATIAAGGVVLQPGLYWATSTPQGSPASPATVTACASDVPFLTPLAWPAATSVADVGQNIVGYQQSGVSGALPSTFSIIGAIGSIGAPVVIART